MLNLNTWPVKKLIIIFSIITFLFSCQKEIKFPVFENMDVTSEFILNNSIILSEKDCAGDTRAHTYICFESVISDSRCPEGAQCFWAGDAEVKFRFVKSGDGPVYFNLHINQSFTNDTIAGGYKFTLKALNPYPSLKDLNLPRVYRAELEIEKQSR